MSTPHYTQRGSPIDPLSPDRLIEMAAESFPTLIAQSVPGLTVRYRKLTLAELRSSPVESLSPRLLDPHTIELVHCSPPSYLDTPLYAHSSVCRFAPTIAIITTLFDLGHEDGRRRDYLVTEDQEVDDPAWTLVDEHHPTVAAERAVLHLAHLGRSWDDSDPQ